MSDVVIKVENLSKVYKLYNNPVDRLKEALHPFRKKYHHDFYALKDVDFEVKKGETIGIIGKNGSGKSTLLKVLTGVLTPSSGHYYVKGKISSLLELGSGFNPELSGLENVYFNGAVLGFSKEEIDRKLNEILEFADIGEFINQPVKTYSSGMVVRLAFAVAVNVDPDVLIVDEALAVGDMFFQAKCMTRMKQMIDSGVTLVLVSHSVGAVKSLCQKTILLDNGIMTAYGKSDEVVGKYFEVKVRSDQVISPTEIDEIPGITDDKTKSGLFKNTAKFKKRASFQRIQNGMANFVNVQLLDMNENEIQLVEFGQEVILRMALEIHKDIHELSYGYDIKDVNGIDVVYGSAGIEDKRLCSLKKGDKYIIDWKFKVALMHGDYNIVCVLSIPVNDDLGQVCFCDYVPLAVQFKVNLRNPIRLFSLVYWDNTIEISKIQS